MANLKTCSRCKNQWYCSVAHQKVHWTEHKKVCKKLEASSVKIEADATKVKPPVNPFAHLAPSKSVERYTMSNIPNDILPVYAVRKEITIRHGYNLMDKAVKELFAGFTNDAYPIEESEGLFGIQMTPAYEQIDGTTSTSLGNLVYLTWLAIWKIKFTEGDPERKAFRNEIVMMILMGKLAEWFQLEVLEYSGTKDGSHNAYANELLRRGMENITYDVLLMKFRWGELDETDIAFLTKTAE
jgi:hypothetical protein